MGLESNTVLYGIVGGGVLLLAIVIAVMVMMRRTSAKPSNQVENARVEPMAPRAAAATPMKAAAAPAPNAPGAVASAAPASISPTPALTPAPPPAAAHAPTPFSTDHIVGDFASLDGWQQPTGGPAPGRLSADGLALAAMEGACSKQSLPVSPGEVVKARYAVCPVGDSVIGDTLRFVAGPMFFSAAGDILSWGSVETLDSGQIGQQRIIEAAAPENAATTRLYIGGYWAQQPPYPAGALLYSAVTLEKA